MADTKRKFVEAYRFPIPAVYSGVIQELLVTQHLARYNTNYAYSAVRRGDPPAAAAATPLRHFRSTAATARRLCGGAARLRWRAVARLALWQR